MRSGIYCSAYTAHIFCKKVRLFFGIENILIHLQSQTQGTHGSLAQLVQSVCLTSRGSGVRIPQLPQKKTPTLVGVFFVLSNPTAARSPCNGHMPDSASQNPGGFVAQCRRHFAHSATRLKALLGIYAAAGVNEIVTAVLRCGG